MSETIWQSDAGGADGDTVELRCDGARSRATEARVGKQWFLAPLSVQTDIEQHMKQTKEFFERMFGAL